MVGALSFLQIGLRQFLAEQECALRSEMQAFMGQVRSVDDDDGFVGLGEGADGGVDGGHVLPDCDGVLLGDEPRERGLLEIEPHLGDQLLHRGGVVPEVGAEVGVVFPGVPEDAFEGAVMALAGQVIHGGADEGGELGIEIAAGFG